MDDTEGQEAGEHDAEDAPQNIPPPPPVAPPVVGSGGELTPELAQKLVKRNYANLVKKVASGRPLSSSELAIINAVADGNGGSSKPSLVIAWASDQVTLAEALRVTRKSVQRWRKEGAPAPESDGRWNVEAWRAWMKAKGKQGGEEEDKGPSKAQLEARRLLLMNEKLSHEIGIIKRDYMLCSEVESRIRSMVLEAKKILLAMPASLAPQVVGQTVPEAEKRIRSAVDEALEKMHTGKK